ncbi:MAG: helix-turn-helix domain-containing protein [Arcobacter sp.]|nr:helix-turn-helix domain-containing protein [Arcobacter sp.]
MERLVTTAQAAQILGLSLQGVHYRIKNNQLKSIKKSGKTYVYITDYMENNCEAKVEVKEVEQSSFREVIQVKDEQIGILKKSIKWMRKQHDKEISRLENNQKRIIGVFNREIELLQSAFNEMRSIYKQPLLHNNTSQDTNKDKFISIQDFTVYLKQHNKTQKDIKTIIIKAIKNNDTRFIYNKKDKKLLILNSDFSDLI